MKDLEDIDGMPILFVLVGNLLTVSYKTSNAPTARKILDECDINANINDYIIPLSLGQILALKSSIDNHDTYNEIASLVEL